MKACLWRIVLASAFPVLLFALGCGKEEVSSQNAQTQPVAGDAAEDTVKTAEGSRDSTVDKPFQKKEPQRQEVHKAVKKGPISIEEVREAQVYVTQGTMVVYTDDEDRFTYVAVTLNTGDLAGSIEWQRDFVVCRKDGKPYEEKSVKAHFFITLPENINEIKVFVPITQYDTVSPSGIVSDIQGLLVTGAPIRGPHMPPAQKEKSHGPMRICLIIDAPVKLLAELALKFKDGVPIQFPAVDPEPSDETK